MSAIPDFNLPDWYMNDLNQLSEPGGSRKLTGYFPLEPLPAQEFNWLMNSVSVWLAFLKDAVIGGFIQVNTTTPIITADRNKLFMIDSSNGSFNLELPDPTENEGLKLFFKDVAGSLGENPVTLVRHDSEEIEGLASNYMLESNFGAWALICDGVDYFIVT